MLSDSPHRKIIDIIDKIDKCMSKQGYNKYQERFHRINKALMSIQLHSDCYVSNFSVESNSDENEKSNCQEHKMGIDDYSTVEPELELKNPSWTSPQKMNMDQLLHFLETQLDQTEKYLNEEMGIQSQSQSREDTQRPMNQRMNANTPIKESNQINLSSLQRDKLFKKYLKIELRLRTYLEEHEWIKKSSNMKKKPYTAVTKQSAFLPYLMKNFFEEKENVQRLVMEMNKRKSVFNEQKLLNELHKLSPNNIISRSEKTEFKPKLHIEKTVSCFNIEDNSTISNDNESNGTQEDESSKVGSFFNQLLRNSIFKDKKKMMMKQESFAEKSEEYEEEKNSISSK